MAYRLNKQQLIEELVKNQIEIPVNATVRQLRNIFDQAKLTTIFGKNNETASGGLESIDENGELEANEENGEIAQHIETQKTSAIDGITSFDEIQKIVNHDVVKPSEKTAQTNEHVQTCKPMTEVNGAKPKQPRKCVNDEFYDDEMISLKRRLDFLEKRGESNKSMNSEKIFKPMTMTKNKIETPKCDKVNTFQLKQRAADLQLGEKSNDENENVLKQMQQIDLQTELLRKQRDMMKSQQEINEMQASCGINSTNQVQTAENRSLNFKSVEDSIVKFDGDDRTFGVNDFFRNFDDVMNNVNANENFKFLCLRNSLIGTARLVLTRGAMNGYIH